MNLYEVYNKIKEDMIAGDAGAVGGDAVLAPNSGITQDDIVGKFDKETGIMGTDNFIMPFKPAKDKSIADGGSIKKKKSKYEQNTKVVDYN